MGIDEIRADFDLLDTWEDRYRYVIELGRSLPDLPAELRTEANKVRGCASQVWLASGPSSRRPGALQFQGDSDAHIVKGLVAILFALYQDRTPAEILALDADGAFKALGLSEHLTPQRSNGLASMVQRVRSDARQG